MNKYDGCALTLHDWAAMVFYMFTKENNTQKSCHSHVFFKELLGGEFCRKGYISGVRKPYENKENLQTPPTGSHGRGSDPGPTANRCTTQSPQVQRESSSISRLLAAVSMEGCHSGGGGLAYGRHLSTFTDTTKRQDIRSGIKYRLLFL